MATQFYLKLLKEAEFEKIKLTKENLIEIKNIYKDVHKDLVKALEKSTDKSLNERWLKDYIKELEKEIHVINKDIEKSITENIDKVVTAQVNSQLKFFNKISDKYDLGLKPTFSSMFSTVKTNVIKELIHGDMYKDRKGLSERIWQDTAKFKKDINTILMEGIAQKKSTLEIARDLEKYVNPDAAKEWEWKKIYPGAKTKVDYNAQRLARTSINHAYQQALKRSCDKNPFVTGIQWKSAFLHGRTCQLCMDRDGMIYNANKDEANYTTEPVPVDHPNGMCSLLPIIEKDLEAIGLELRSWLDGESNSELDDWFKEFGLEFTT